MANFCRNRFCPTVALRKESVDRNIILNFLDLSNVVALRKESVDRNIPRGQLPATQPPSLSARRAWIEISGVDFSEDWLNGRSPQGERG